MGPLHFNIGLVEFLANHRTPALTHLFRGASLVGSSWVYVALVVLIYVEWDKRLAMRLSCVVLFTMSLNDILKIFIANPRPFVQEGTYLKKWAVSPSQAKVLAAEYSTPSGHAMVAANFYSYLCVFVGNRWFRTAFVLVVVLIGCSRPYLGVHYVEDVLLGWALGLATALVGARYSESFSALWERCPYVQQIAIAVLAGMALYMIAVALDGWNRDGQALTILVYTGLLTGTVIARSLELRIVNFDPRSGSMAAKILRGVFTLGSVAVVLLLFRMLFAAMAVPIFAPAYLLLYLGYTAAGVAGMFFAPLLFTRMGLAEKTVEEPESSLRG